MDLVVALLLTPTEQAVMMDVYDGMSNKEIAKKHGVSSRTTRNHLTSIYSKLEEAGSIPVGTYFKRPHAVSWLHRIVDQAELSPLIHARRPEEV